MLRGMWRAYPQQKLLPLPCPAQVLPPTACTLQLAQYVPAVVDSHICAHALRGL